MREHWERPYPNLNLALAEAERLIWRALPEAKVVDLVVASGGLANTNLRVALAGPPHTVLLRLYQRDPTAAAREAALARLVQTTVPVARVLHHAADNPVNGTAYAVMEWIEGERLETLALDGNTCAEAGRAIGETLARIHAHKFFSMGSLDAQLRVTPFGADFELEPFLTRCLMQEPGSARIEPDLAQRVIDFAKAHESPRWDAPPTLTHFDFGASNILMRHEDGHWRVAAVLDWEFAASASPAADFGNLLRPPLGLRREFIDGIAEGYRAAGGSLPENWLTLARVADLPAWAELLARPLTSPALIEDAKAVFEATLA